MIIDWLKRESILKLDFINDDYEIGWLWLAFWAIINYPMFKQNLPLLISDVQRLINWLW